MVDTFNDPGLPLSPTRKRTTSSREPMSMDKPPNFPSDPKLQWAGSRGRNLGSARGGAFFLDIPFYRTHWPDCWRTKSAILSPWIWHQTYTYWLRQLCSPNISTARRI